MATGAEMVSLPYTQDLGPAAVAHLCAALNQPGGHKAYGSFDLMRQYVAEKIVTLTFRRYLEQQGVPYALGPYADPKLLLGGRRATLNVALLSDRKAIAGVRADEHLWQNLPALMPHEDNYDLHTVEEIYVFATLLGLITNSQKSLQKAAAAGQTVHLLHPLPEHWRLPNHWQPLGEMVLKAEVSQPIDVQIVGLDAQRQPIHASYSLSPQARVVVREDFYALRYFFSSQIADGPVGIYSPILDEAIVANQYAWGNVGVYGVGVLLLGYLGAAAYQGQASFVPQGSKRFGMPRTLFPTWGVPAAALHPMEDLLGRVRKWAGKG